MRLLEQLDAQETLFETAVAQWRGAGGQSASYAAEWMLDNFYVVQQAIRQIREDMPRGFYRKLVKLPDYPDVLDGIPRIYAVAQEFITGERARLDAADIERARRFMQLYQDVQRDVPLTMAELWALPVMLRLSVLEYLAQTISRITDIPFTSLPVTRTLPSELPDEEIVANCIVSLRALSVQDWQLFFESISRVERTLREDPAGVYTGMDKEARDHYRKVIEEFASVTGVAEQDVAQAAVDLARTAAEKSDISKMSGFSRPARTHHIGYYLLDRGKAELEARLNYRPAFPVRVRDSIVAHPTPVYLGGIALVTLVLLLIVIVYARNVEAPIGQVIAVVLIALIPASAVAISIVDWLVTLLVRPRVLPKMDFSAGIPDNYRGLVVIPALLTNAKEVRSLLQQLELHYLRNPEPHLHFALLTDFADSTQAHEPNDQALINQASAGIHALNAKYQRATGAPFLLLHRERRWNPKEQVFMGWERKRGKLHELNQLLRESTNGNVPDPASRSVKRTGDREINEWEADETQSLSFCAKVGDLHTLPKVKYVITLDADTVLPRDGAQRLIGTLAHPLNVAEFDPLTGKVTAGYIIVQPRVEIMPMSANRSLFTRIYAGDVGIDLYTRAVSNVYQDLFGAGIYVGKGIYDVDAFERSLQGRVPENTLLSHDLFEGIHGRVALATDVVMLEDYPPNYLVHIRRSRRWIRGDWQLLPWLLPRVPCADGSTVKNDLSIIDRWKILDNLRRSLLAPTLLVMLILGWLWLPGSPLVWTLLGALSLAAPVLIGTATGLLRAIKDQSLRHAFPPFVTGLLRWLLALAFLPYETVLTLGSIVVTLARMSVTRQNLLQWVTAAQAIEQFGQEVSLLVTSSKMLSTLLFTGTLTIAIAAIRPQALPFAAPFLLTWTFSPYAAYWISKPIRYTLEPLSNKQRVTLRRLARRTWLFFERFVGPEDHWLPPDNFQESPRGIIASHTSPTNIGLILLSTLSAHDLGYIGVQELASRLRLAFETLNRLEQYRGHFLNWYDTRTLEPLPPRYVSTVDSGNLAACLRVLGQGCHELPSAPVLRHQSWHGFLDTLGLLDEVATDLSKLDAADASDLDKAVRPLQAELKQIRARVQKAGEKPEQWAALLQELSGVGRHNLEQVLSSLVESHAPAMGVEPLQRVRLAAERFRIHLDRMQQEMNALLPWLSACSRPPEQFEVGHAGLRTAWRTFCEAMPIAPTLAQLNDVYATGQSKLAELRRILSESHECGGECEACAWCEQLAEQMQSAEATVQSLLDDFKYLDEQCEGYFGAMDFSFLFNRQRELFHIGYNLSAARLDDNYYDLLASEARIASLIAIAKGDVPLKHWLYLGRSVTQVNGAPVLMSWSATMFEYLMPSLLMRSYEGTLLHLSARGAVEAQIAYGKRKNVPWGVSESGYYAFDAALNYQYRAFGVPALGFKRDLGEDLVVAPYASMLALTVKPRDVLDNLAHLARLNMLGAYGLYEAVDFTTKRLTLGVEHAIVRSYMAHHQGMILLALANSLDGDKLVRRFHADPRMKSVELILQEKAPLDAPIEQPGLETTSDPSELQPHIVTTPWSVPVHSPAPQVHFLSNGRYGVLLSNAGGGFSRWRNVSAGQDVELTRWRADTTLDSFGTWLYVQDLNSNRNGRGEAWSVCQQPMSERGGSADTQFFTHMAVFRRSADGISSTLEVAVAPDDDVELRRLSLANHSDETRRLRLTSYGEVVLSPQATDMRHPAFNKLFIESEYVAEANALVFRRRPRSQAEADTPIYLAHALVPPSGAPVTGERETDRARFLGRNSQAPRTPQALRNTTGVSAKPNTFGASRPLSGRRDPSSFDPSLDASGRQSDSGRSVGERASKERTFANAPVATLDPIFSLGQDITLKPHETMRVCFMTLAASSRSQAISLAKRYRNWHLIDRSFDHARARAELELHRLNLGTPQIERFQHLLSALLYPNNALRTDPATIASNRKGQSGLWPYGISGDYPILLVRLHDEDELQNVSEGELAQELVQAHIYWRNRGLKIDLVFLIYQPGDYNQELRGQLQRLLARMESDDWLNRRGGIFIVNADQAGEDGRVLLETAARVVLDSTKGSLANQLASRRMEPARLPPFVPTGIIEREPEGTLPLERPKDLVFDNGFGGFSKDGREYVVYLEPGQHTPAPWTNVIANPNFGFIVTESGASYTWQGNSGENRLTPWSNDPVRDTPGEAIYLRDEETAEVWSPTPAPAPADAPYLIRHGVGYSTFEHHSHHLKQHVRIFAAPDAPVKIVRVKLENASQRPRRITATFYAEWVLGVQRDDSQQYVVSEFDNNTQALLARNTYSAEFGECVAFAAASHWLHGLTADRAEFLGRMGDISQPAALSRIGLASAVEPGLDPCAALQLHLDLQPGGSEEVYFILGQGNDRADALRLVEHFQDAKNVEAAWQATNDLWDELMGAVQVNTPDPAMNLLLNRWLLYQALSCRIWGRSAFYQSSGAFGFRDQLQDVMALIHAKPEIAREHILRSARHQFEAGDVLHWWHPPSGRGVRTRISDDLLWLPFVTTHYVTATGDESILHEHIPFRTGAPLGPNEEERYSQYGLTYEMATLYEHCKRAIAKGTTSGAHGLPLMGTGDWNDGMNRVGVHGKGESVWLGWFMCATLDRFAEVCEQMDEARQAEAYRARMREFAQAIESNTWDGAWYIRAFYDDGTPLGASRNLECKIDAIAQSWAVISGMGDSNRARQAMRSVAERLVREDDGLILLFTPPLDKTERDPGYIKGYAPGIRENGGQYTHAALWTVWAFAELGDGERADALFRLLNPIYHADRHDKVMRYKVEPYVIAADVYGAPPHTGRGGWTWYTGSSGWMYRLGLEAILGIQRIGDALRIKPCISSQWDGYDVTYRVGDATYHIHVENPNHVCTGVKQITLDGEVISANEVPLRSDGQRHEVRVVMG